MRRARGRLWGGSNSSVLFAMCKYAVVLLRDVARILRVPAVRRVRRRTTRGSLRSSAIAHDWRRSGSNSNDAKPSYSSAAVARS